MGIEKKNPDKLNTVEMTEIFIPKKFILFYDCFFLEEILATTLIQICTLYKVLTFFF